MLSNRVFEDLCKTLSLHQQLFMWDTLGTAKQKRIASTDQCVGALAIMQGEDRVGFVHIKRGIAHLEQTGLAPEHLITGHDLLEAGVEPNSALGDVLEAVYDAQLEGSVTSKEQALEFAMTIYKNFQDPYVVHAAILERWLIGKKFQAPRSACSPRLQLQLAQQPSTTKKQ